MKETTYTIENHPDQKKCLQVFRSRMDKYYSYNFEDFKEACRLIQQEFGGEYTLKKWKPKTGEGFDLKWEGHDKKKVAQAVKKNRYSNSIFWVPLILEALHLGTFCRVNDRVIEEEERSNSDEGIKDYLSDQILNIHGKIVEP